MMLDMGGAILAPAKYDKFGPAYRKSEVVRVYIGKILSNNYFEKRAKDMNEDAKKAVQLTQDMIDAVDASLTKLVEREKQFSEQSKKISGSVRDAADKLSGGLAKVEKAADFNRLENYVSLLERAAAAMHSLAELESKGKLDKIAAAIR